MILEQEKEESVRSKARLVVKSNPSGPFSSLKSCLVSSVSYQHTENSIRIEVIGISTVATIREVQNILESEYENSSFSRIEFDLRYSDPVLNKVERLVELGWFWYKKLKNKDKIVRIRMSPTLLKEHPIKDKEIRELLGDRGYRTNGFRIQASKCARSEIVQSLCALALPDDIPNVPDLLHTLAATNSRIAKQEQEIRSLEKQKNLSESFRRQHLAYKRLARYSLLFVTFFTCTLAGHFLFSAPIIVPFWNGIGLILSIAFYLMSIALKKDWQKSKKKHNG